MADSNITGLPELAATPDSSDILPIVDGGTETKKITVANLLASKAAVAQTFYIGSTQVAINRGTATLNLTGIGTLGVGAITTTGNFSQTGATTFGTGTGTVSINGSIQIASAKTLKFNAGATVGTIGTTFVDNDTSLMTSQAIKEKIENYGYSVEAGTVTSVAAITLGTIGTDLSSSVATGTTTAVITLNVPTASTSNRGVLSSTDWDTFNGKASSGANSDITSITGLTTDLTIAQGGTGASTLAGASIPTYTSTNTFTNKRITARVKTFSSDATPDIDSDDYDAVTITAQTEAITDVNMSGTPTNFQKLIFRIRDDNDAGGYAITWGDDFEDAGVALPIITVADKILTVGFIYNTVTSKFGCVAVANET